MWFQDFQDGRTDGYLGLPNGTILAILNLYVAPLLPTKFWLNPTYGFGGDVVRRISRMLPSEQRNRRTLAILNLYVAPMPPIKFQLIQFTVWKAMLFEEFQDDRLGILVIGP